MNKDKDRAIAYSLLAYIRNSGTLIKGPLDIFKPLVKRAISIMNHRGIYQGESIIEIKKEFDEIFDIDIPIPVLRGILEQIANEVNVSSEKESFVLFQDGSFSISEYTFYDHEETIKQKQEEIDRIEILFKKFCESSDIETSSTSTIFSFIEKNKFELSKYFSSEINNTNVDDYTAEAQFIRFFRKIPELYSQIKDIYIGSIISGYILYNPNETNINIELLFDTNFIIGLLDLNTPESHHTCNTLIELAKKQNYKIRILKDTIEETKNLLDQKAKNFDSNFLYKSVFKEDIYNACYRKKLKKNDLERISDNLEVLINNLGIAIINDVKTKNEAKFSEEYKRLKEIRSNSISALHDATAIHYVRKVRKGKIKEFEKVNCWFVNNNTSKNDALFLERDGYQPELINADDLLNILWLSNPQTKLKINLDDLADIGLTSSISITLNKNLPKAKIIKELDDNIHKYASEELSDSDIIRIATRITNNQLKDIKELNDLVKDEKEGFVKRLTIEANKQKLLEEQIASRFEGVIKELSKRSDELFESKKIIEGEDNSKNSKIEALQNRNNILIEKMVNNKMKKWKRQSIFIMLILLSFPISIFIIFYFNTNNDLDNTIKKVMNFDNQPLLKLCFVILSPLLNIFGLKLVYDRYFNHSNINNKLSQVKRDLEKHN
ncbi:hypothetical protein NBRC110019_20900 [Neptunitalea chrysea]|uniref:Uncharacterized protein n=1 Tax=Neptunitalea chrysea TaxID=1647581 RepID=A0A9W6B5Q4_9FLAO|nr:hypothetical protein [Neptunitalea chrysea]GLB53050.1 hypothetical protein NBRC110019_20900 [Neptunitalea chrysea]